MRLDIFSVEDLQSGPDLTANKGESQVSTPTSIGQSGVNGETVSVAVKLLCIGSSVLVGGKQFELVEVSGRCLDIGVVRRHGVLDFLNVRAQGGVVLLQGVLASDLQLRTNGPLPLLGGILLDLSGTRSAMLLSKGSSRDIGLLLDTVKVRLSLLDVGGSVGVVVGLEVRYSVVS